jgi:hypothetical protein
MKIGMRKPSVKRMVKARPIGRAKRALKKQVIPGYGKQSPINLHPIKTAKAKVYRKTTFSLRDLFK